MILAARTREGRRPRVLVHGLAGSSAWMDPLFRVAPEGVGLLAVDLLGHGESARSVPASWSRQAEAILTTTEGSGARVLVLHSMSSAVLPELLASARFAGIVLIEGDVAPDQAEWSRSVAAMDDDRLRSYFPRFQAAADTVMRSQLPRGTSREVAHTMALSFRSADAWTVRDLSREGIARLASGAIEDALVSSRVPVRYIAGRRLPQGAERVLARVGATVTRIGRSHFPMIDDPAGTMTEILRADTLRP